MKINENNASKLPSQKIVIGQIADSSGHTDFEGTGEEAMPIIMEQVQKHGKWVYVNGSPFIFNNVNDPVEEGLLRDLLLNAENPSFVVTGKLQGGAKSVIRNRVMSTPVSSFFNTKNRPQLAVVFKKNHGKEYVDVVVSNYKGSRAKLAAYKSQILKGITNALKNSASKGQ